mmetsp:Transcript_22991/g.38812  ORF Transcript_22991/g.38812 Transcript_22991/m.38812 type:complete len:147 (+) Transcript_22991:623-1063(+)
MTTYAMDMERVGAPMWLKVAGAVGVIWYAFGLLQFWLGFSMNVGAAVEAGAISAAHGAAITGTPGLIWLAFAVASAAGLVGSALLIGGSAMSKLMFGLSLVSAAIYYAWVYGISGTGADRPAEELIIGGVVGAVTLGFFLLSRRVT